MTDSGFYRAFEDRHRGSRELIAGRLRAYLPFIRGLMEAVPGRGGVDLGCGRGEWLELLAAEGFPCCGVDLDEGMLADCRARGLPAERGDAIEWLRSQADASLALVSAFHLVEHLPFNLLQTLVIEAKRVLAPSGLLILETQNPENLAVATDWFYLDPTHVRPLPPSLLSFLAEFHGFVRVRVLRLQHDPVLMSADWIGARNLLEGASPDYAVIAQITGQDPALKALDEAFAVEDGVSRSALADRADYLVGKRFAEVNNRLALGDARVAELVQRIAALEAPNRAAAALAESRGRELEAVYASRSWRLTAPLRAVGRRFGWIARQVRASGVRGLLGAATRALLARPLARLRASKRLDPLAGRILRRFPGLRPRVRRILSRYGVGASGAAFSGALRPDPAYPGHGFDSSEMSRTARRVFRDLKIANSRRERSLEH